MVKSSERPFNRVTVAIDHSPQDKGTLDQAIALAERLQAELVALFIEDENLLHLAKLPFAQEVHRSSAAVRRLMPGRSHDTSQNKPTSCSNR